jgi:DNA-binding response OmpR family regulator
MQKLLVDYENARFEKLYETHIDTMDPGVDRIITKKSDHSRIVSTLTSIDLKRCPYDCRSCPIHRDNSFKISATSVVNPRKKTLSSTYETKNISTGAVRLLCAFSTHPNKIISKQDLLHYGWGETSVENNVNVTISEIRRAIGNIGITIRNIRKIGFTLITDIDKRQP